MTGTLASRVRSVEILDRFASHHASVCTRHPRRDLSVRDTLFWSPDFVYLAHDMGTSSTRRSA